MTEKTIELKKRKYTEQLNTKVSSHELEQLKYCVMIGQYKSVSDFIRTAIIEKLEKLEKD